MDHTAIETIAKLAIQENNKNENFVIHFDNQEIHDLEQYLPAPKSFRGAFETTLVTSFTAYLNHNASLKSTAIYIDHINGKAKAIIDMGTVDNPQWGRHTAELNLAKTPEYAAILKLNNVAVSQQDFIDFLEDYSETMVFLDNDGNPIDFAQGVSKFRKLKIDANSSKEQEVGNYSHHASALESIEILAAGHETPPAGLSFTVRPYEDFDPQTFKAHIRALSDGKKITLKYRIIGLDQVKEAIADELVKMIYDGLTVLAIPTYIGKMEYPLD